MGLLVGTGEIDFSISIFFNILHNYAMVIYDPRNFMVSMTIAYVLTCWWADMLQIREATRGPKRVRVVQTYNGSLEMAKIRAAQISSAC